MGLKKRFNTLFFKIIFTVIIGVSSLTIALSVLNIRTSRQVFVENFTESQTKIFTQIDHNIYGLFSDVAEITSGLNRNRAVHDYLTKTTWETGEENATIFNMKQYLDELPIRDNAQFSLLLIGLNEKTHNYNSSAKLVVPANEIIRSDIATKALASPNKLVCQLGDSGYTDVMRSQSVIFMAKAITYDAGENIDGVVILTMKEDDFQNYYDYFTSNTSDIIIFNQDGDVLSSNNSLFLGENPYVTEIQDIRQQMIADDIVTKSIEQNSNPRSYMLQRLQSTNYTIMGIISPDRAFRDAYNFYKILGVSAAITLVVATLIFLFIRQQTDPLSKLVQSMRHVPDGNLKSFAPVEGTTETKELSETYNNMLIQIEHYISELVDAEAAKREAEIHSLQMQINPHYMYNTLASIKWLIWQQEKTKSIQVIDAFIALLRNTISNKSEFIPLESEVENLKNYVLINQVRYGDQINVEYYVSDDCSHIKVPKLILQPFVENAFFHAFPKGHHGVIQIFVKKTVDFLKFDIIDDGIGMDYNTLTNVKNTHGKGEHFTGIGINNVDERIKLIYGNNYGINIESQEGTGTTVTILLPYREQETSSPY